MDPDTHDIDIWLNETLNNWAEQGTLSSQRSAQLQMGISKLAYQEKKRSFIRKICSLVAAIITFLWFLFANCPVAAAACTGNTVVFTHVFQFKTVSLVLILFGFIIKKQFDINNEVCL